jgi:hypothetical protein
VTSSQDVTAKKLKEMEERMLGFDAFLAALPTWKEDLVGARIHPLSEHCH